MTSDQIREAAERAMIKYRLAESIREQIDKARETYGPHDLSLHERNATMTDPQLKPTGEWKQFSGPPGLPPEEAQKLASEQGQAVDMSKLPQATVKALQDADKAAKLFAHRMVCQCDKCKAWRAEREKAKAAE